MYLHHQVTLVFTADDVMKKEKMMSVYANKMLTDRILWQSL